MSLSEIESSIDGINQKMLLEHLKVLQEFSVISKKTYEAYSLSVAYSLTEDKGIDYSPYVETIDLYNNSENRGKEKNYGINYQKIGEELMTVDELEVMDSSK
jgi:DNA-binding HxlR family transcriptional regulator